MPMSLKILEIVPVLKSLLPQFGIVVLAPVLACIPDFMTTLGVAIENAI